MLGCIASNCWVGIACKSRKLVMNALFSEQFAKTRQLIGLVLPLSLTATVPFYAVLTKSDRVGHLFCRGATPQENEAKHLHSMSSKFIAFPIQMYGQGSHAGSNVWVSASLVFKTCIAPYLSLFCHWHYNFFCCGSLGLGVALVLDEVVLILYVARYYCFELEISMWCVDDELLEQTCDSCCCQSSLY